MRGFFDTNLLIYAFSQDPRGETARAMLEAGGVVSVQCLNEFADLAIRKLKLNWHDLNQGLARVRELCEVVALDLDLHDSALAVARRYRLRMFDSLIVAAALRSDCDTLWSEDMPDGLVVERQVTIRNPFRSR